MTECPVCFEDASSKIFVRLPCASMGHSLCMGCFIHLQQRKCPLCRVSFEEKIPFIKETTRTNLITFLTIQSLPTDLHARLRQASNFSDAVEGEEQAETEQAETEQAETEQAETDDRNNDHNDISVDILVAQTRMRIL